MLHLVVWCINQYPTKLPLLTMCNAEEMRHISRPLGYLCLNDPLFSPPDLYSPRCISKSRGSFISPLLWEIHLCFVHAMQTLLFCSKQ